MPRYLYRCNRCENEREEIHEMSFEGIMVCNRRNCLSPMHRVPQLVSINWNGVKPSGGGIDPSIEQWAADAPRRRAEFDEVHEQHEKDSNL